VETTTGRTRSCFATTMAATSEFQAGYDRQSAMTFVGRTGRRIAIRRSRRIRVRNCASFVARPARRDPQSSSHSTTHSVPTTSSAGSTYYPYVEPDVLRRTPFQASPAADSSGSSSVSALHSVRPISPRRWPSQPPRSSSRERRSRGSSQRIDGLTVEVATRRRHQVYRLLPHAGRLSASNSAADQAALTPPLPL